MVSGVESWSLGFRASGFVFGNFGFRVLGLD